MMMDVCDNPDCEGPLEDEEDRPVTGASGAVYCCLECAADCDDEPDEDEDGDEDDDFDDDDDDDE
jgi:hypothetical protein